MFEGAVSNHWKKLRNWLKGKSGQEQDGRYKRVALLYPAKRYMGCWPALGLAYIAAMLEKDGHTVKIIDRNPVLLKGEDIDAFTSEALDDFKPDIIGITATTPLMEDVVRILGLLKEDYSETLLVMGGPHVTAIPEETLNQYSEVDIVVRGEGEFTMAEIVAGRPLPEILGITWRNNGEIQSNLSRPLISNLDELPLPARHLFDMDFYLKPDNPIIRGIRGIRATHIYNARGCSFRCKFCAGSAVFGREVRSHSSGRIVGEINHLIEKYEVEGLYFDEDVFFSSRQRAEAICKALIEAKIPEKIKWAGLMRANSAPLDILEMMKEAGCVQVEYGFETGSPRMLKEMRKGVTLEQNYEAARNTHKAGMRILASMIVGCPSETLTEFDETIEFLRDIEPHHIGFNKFVPLPGSQFYNDLLVDGKLDSSHDWGVFHVGGNFPEHESISYSDVNGKEFFTKFCETQQSFVRDSNLVGTIISLLDTMEEKRYGFDFSIVKPELFPLAIPEPEIAAYDLVWKKALHRISNKKPFVPDNLLLDSNLSMEARVALLNNLGIHCMGDFRLRPAASCLNLAHKEMTSPQVLANLGVLTFRRKELVRADDYFSAALEVAGPLRKPVCWSHANTALLSGRLNLAFERYTKIDREFACYDGQMGLAACYVLRGDFDRAGTCWEKASEKGNFAGVDRNLKAKAQLEATGERISGYQPITVFSDLFY